MVRKTIASLGIKIEVVVRVEKSGIEDDGLWMRATDGGISTVERVGIGTYKSIQITNSAKYISLRGSIIIISIKDIFRPLLKHPDNDTLLYCTSTSGRCSTRLLTLPGCQLH